MGKLSKILYTIFAVAICGVVIVLIPGLLWLIFGLIVEFLNLIDKWITAFYRFWTDLLWNIKIPICFISGLILYLVILKPKLLTKK